MVAAFALDGTEKDPDLAYSLALKAFNLYGSQMHKATLAITSANLANARFKHGKYAEALDLQRKAIGIYESSPPGFMEAFAGTNFWRWYQNAAWLSCNTGDFVEANKFSRTAVEKHPSDATVPYRLTILRQLGSNEEVVSLMTQWFTPVINRRVISFAFKTNSNSQ
jgi:tetratricopeptide (TPR) repeat protein